MGCQVGVLPIARTMRKGANAAEQLAIKVKKGTKGTWGQIPMPSNVTVKDSDIKTLVAFILTLQRCADAGYPNHYAAKP